ncbi:Sulfurtransferase TusA [compost metagenome]
MAGYTAENVLSGRTNVFVPKDLESRDPATTILVDVRSEIEHANGHIPDSLLIPVDDLRSRLGELDREKEIWVYCQVGLRGYTASRILQQKGYKVKNLTGGYKTYVMANYKPGTRKLDDGDGKLSAQSQIAATAEATEAQPNAAHADQDVRIDAKLDACGLCCPGPLIQLKMKMEQLKDGEVLQVIASDPGFYEDVQAWVKMSKNQLLDVKKNGDGMIEALLRKGAGQEVIPSSTSNAATSDVKKPEGSSMVVFSGDLDKAIASFIIANGAAASGKKVTMFFTFWGLNVIRRPEKVQVNKSMIGRMFGAMMPRGSRKLSMSKMNMMGIGAKMIRGVMNNANISSLEDLMQTALDQGVEIVACQMSMDVMGITREELIDGVKIGGVGYYLGKADESGINLFI